MKSENELDIQFFKFIAEHGKQYKTAQEVKLRFDQFKKNLGEIKKLIKSGDLTHDVAVNYMADWTAEEYKSLLNYRSRPHSVRTTLKSNLNQMFDHVDWNQRGYVSAVKDQGSCGSCWAFSAVAPLESAYAIKKDLKNNDIPLFSEQQIVDCSHEFGSLACDGGFMEGAMEHWLKHTPVLQSEYPYTGVEGTCKEDSIIKTTKSPVKNIDEYYMLEEDKNGEEIMHAIQDGPISVAVDASGLSFQFYSKGVVTNCKNTGLNHGVTAVGYGSESGKEFFLIKNSWGSRWGDKGFIKLGVSGNNCGVNEEPLVLVL